MNTMQEEFDIVVAHLFKQGKPAKDENGVCKMLTEDGLKCAVGCRISDVQLAKELDDCGMGIKYSVECDNLLSLPKEIVKYVDMFQELQRIHDSGNVCRGEYFNIPVLTKRLKDVAKEFNLQFNMPTEAI